MKKHAAIITRKIKLADAKPHEKNPRQHPAKDSEEWNALKLSVQDEYFDPLVWNKRNGKLVSGHLRHTILLDLGYQTADMVVVDWDEKTHIARMIAANRHGGKDDLDALAKLLTDLPIAAPTGISKSELDDILAKLTVTKPKNKTDLSGRQLTDKFEIVVECANEAEQRKTFEKLTKAYKCRLLTF